MTWWPLESTGQRVARQCRSAAARKSATLSQPLSKLHSSSSSSSSFLLPPHPKRPRAVRSASRRRQPLVDETFLRSSATRGASAFSLGGLSAANNLFTSPLDKPWKCCHLLLPVRQLHRKLAGWRRFGQSWCCSSLAREASPTSACSSSSRKPAESQTCAAAAAALELLERKKEQLLAQRELVRASSGRELS